MSWESPIEGIIRNINIQYEDGIIKAVQSVGFNVNKEELAKALKYDRGQYEKGFRDGRPPKGEWNYKGLDFDIDSLYQCSVCEHFHWAKSNYCPNCGARMVEE